jgi:type II secretory pathway pseudopilin PulG
MKGFTVIELVVSISISLLVAGGIIANYNTYNTNQLLKQTALTLKNNLRLLESKAAAGEKPTTVCTTLEGWMITFSTNSYTYKAKCNIEAVTDETIISLPTGVSFETLPLPNPIIFNVLARGTNLDSTISITLSGFGKQYSLQLSPGGDMSDLKFQ